MYAHTYYDLKRFHSSAGKTHSILPIKSSQQEGKKGSVQITKENRLSASWVGQEVKKLKTKVELSRAGTHIIVFLSGQRWLHRPFWAPHLHLQLDDLERDTGRRNLATLSL